MKKYYFFFKKNNLTFIFFHLSSSTPAIQLSKFLLKKIQISKEMSIEYSEEKKKNLTFPTISQ